MSCDIHKLFHCRERRFCKMWSLILLLSISSIVAYESPVYRQEEWNIRNENSTTQDQFYEGFFDTRIDHFKPLNQNTTSFVSFFLSSSVGEIMLICAFDAAISCECQFLCVRRSFIHLPKRL